MKVAIYFPNATFPDCMETYLDVSKISISSRGYTIERLNRGHRITTVASKNSFEVKIEKENYAPVSNTKAKAKSI